MSSVGYKVDTSAVVALSAGVAKTALMVITPAQFGGVITHITISFDGVTSGAVPAFCEIVRSTNATNSTPGTANTSETANIVQIRGRAITTGFTAFSASTSEPTVLTRLRGYLLTPAAGLLDYEWPLGRELECDVSAGLGVRLTAPAAVNARVGLDFERL